MFCIIYITAFIFNPQWIDALPLGALWIKQLFVFATMAVLWVVLSLAAVANDR
jgi:hypothetical protein